MSKWDRRFIEMASMIAGWSKDNRRKIGCVIVRPDRTVASLGYNGLPRGIENDDPTLLDRETKNALTVHAEINAIVTAREPLQGYTLYVSPYFPCAPCAGVIVQSGIKRIVTDFSEVIRPSPDWVQSFMLAQKTFKDASVIVDMLEPLNPVVPEHAKKFEAYQFPKHDPKGAGTVA